MSSQAPFAQLVGVWQFWLAPFDSAAEAEPDLDGAVAGDFVSLGCTDGEQNMEWQGDLQMFRDNCSLGPTKAVRPEDGFMVKMTLVNLTYETLASAMGLPSSAIVGGNSGALTAKRLPIRRSYIPTHFTLLGRGGAIGTNTMSPYLAGPAQIYIPKAVISNNPSIPFGKSTRSSTPIEVSAIEDAAQDAGFEFGSFLAQSA